jgi:glycosyltransferase involved in cell wall biosynthesis
MKISYAIPVCNEINELQRLVKFLTTYKREEDEIVILFDSQNGSKAVEEYLRAKTVNTKSPFVWFSNPLNNDFAQQKNYLTKMCTGDWVFLIDADEYPDEYLCTALPWMIENNPDVEAYWVSRINTVTGLTPAHTQKWGWNINSKGWVNFPDKQLRIYKNNPDQIKWVKPVHEQLVGYDKFASLPGNEEYCLYHPKDIERQERQNKFYETL